MLWYRWNNHKNEKIPIGKIICLARTYLKHADEMNSVVPKTPILFLKPTSSIIFSGESIIYPDQSKCVHHEIELGVIIGETGKNLPKVMAWDYILGYCIALDITARDIQQDAKIHGLPWTIAKGFDTFAPISDIVPKNEVSDPHDILIQLSVNGNLKQQESTSQLIWEIPTLLSYISSIMTLERGDLILTGTPSGVSEIHKGDQIQATADIPLTLDVTVK